MTGTFSAIEKANGWWMEAIGDARDCALALLSGKGGVDEAQKLAHSLLYGAGFASPSARKAALGVAERLQRGPLNISVVGDAVRVAVLVRQHGTFGPQATIVLNLDLAPALARIVRDAKEAMEKKIEESQHGHYKEQLLQLRALEILVSGAEAHVLNNQHDNPAPKEVVR